MSVLVNRIKRVAAAIAVSAVALSPAAVPAVSSAGTVAVKSITLHSGEFCTKRKQRMYHRHGYTCRKASDGRLRLFTR